ncbi:serine hydrolase domain-containing protein [Tenacibaculum amylolyticum]|uniref:serine hydrolase domain-containing protein n=1 Tax=Tenacibaculum amylolyticum TaxID=104269 RepID=UPI003895378B
MKKIVFIVLSLIVMTTFTFCSSPQDWFYKRSSFQGTPLKKNLSLQNTDYTKARLDSFENYLKKLHTTSLMVVQNGEVIYKYGNTSKINYLASCRKSVLSMLYGKYVENGTINLKETIGEIGIDEDDGLLPIEKKATVNDIITARSGVFHIPANGGYDTQNVKKRGSVEPGTYFLYNNWDFNVAGHILELKSGNTIYEELEQQLAIPLGFEDWNIKNQKKYYKKKKSRYPAYHMYLSTRDMAKVGQLMLNEGKWNGKQLISKNWINKITTTVTPTAVVTQERFGWPKDYLVQLSYGYMWWLFDRFYDNPDFEGAYYATGWGGQFIMVIPKLNMVIAHKTRVDLVTLTGLAKHNVSDPQFFMLVNRFTSKK